MIKKKEKELLILARKVFKNNKLSISDTPEKVKNWDSMQHLKFLAEVEKKFKKKLTFQQALMIKRVKDILKYI
tara:strand:- start:25 stop:243 length:219 start_codon:yes stop_codon:yes gene_type:complete